MIKNVGYNGNQFVKKANIEHNFTGEQVKEYLKCKNDIIYFIRTYCKIVTLDRGLELFQPFDYQIRMIEAFENNKFVVNLLPRQMGKTAIVAAYLLHYAMFNEDKMIGILANKALVAREILSRIQRMYENLPMWIQPGVKEWNKGSMELGNGSILMSSATSSSSIRGFAFNIIYLDEFAHISNQIHWWESTYPVISSGSDSKVIITSTPNGLDLFYKIYTEAEQGINNFTPVKVDWWEHPKRDEAWKEETLRNIGYEQFEQEFLCQFLGSSGTLISGNSLKNLASINPLKFSNNISVYSEVEKDKTYVAIVDVSRGKGLDYYAIQVIDVTKMPYKQVCVFKDNGITPVEFTEIIYRVCKTYNECAVLIEINDIGAQVSDLLLFDYEYENILYTETNGRSGKQISTGYSNNKSIDKGIRTTKTVKSVGCSILKLLIEQNQLIINDADTIKELTTFSRKANSYEAEPGCNDDLVMCLVLFAWLSDQKYFKELTDISTLSALRENSVDSINDSMLSFGFMDNGIPEESVVSYGDEWDIGLFDNAKPLNLAPDRWKSVII